LCELDLWEKPGRSDRASFHIIRGVIRLAELPSALERFGRLLADREVDRAVEHISDLAAGVDVA
jgi:hypothetical protein